MLNSKLYWGYLTSTTQMVQPPALSQIGLSLNNNSAFAFVGSLRDIVSYCCKHSSIKVVLQRASSISRDVDPRIDRIEVEVKTTRKLYSVMNPLSSVMVTLRPHSMQHDLDAKPKSRRKRFTLPATCTLLDLAANLNQVFALSSKPISETIPNPRHGTPGLHARSGSRTLLLDQRRRLRLPDAEIDLELPTYTAEADGQAGGFGAHVDVLAPPPPPYFEAIGA
ncbi:hypothetical protein Unana1_06657 [Umbelopsis nana]